MSYVNQPHESAKRLSDEFQALFGSGSSPARPRKDYKEEWGYRIERVKDVMDSFDPENMRKIRQGIRRLAQEMTGELIPLDGEASYNPVTGLITRLRSAEEKAREAYSDALKDSHADQHTVEGMRDFCDMMGRIGDYLESMENGSEKWGTRTGDILSSVGKYGQDGVQNGVPDRPKFAQMIVSFNRMVNRLIDDKQRHGY